MDGSSLEGDFVKGHPHGYLVMKYAAKDGKKRVCRQGRYVRGILQEWLDYNEEEEEVASGVANFLMNQMQGRKEDAELEELGLWGEGKIPDFEDNSVVASSITEN